MPEDGHRYTYGPPRNGWPTFSTVGSRLRPIERKPIVLVDMDGPLADFDGYFYEQCIERGWTLDATCETQTARYMSDHVVSKAERKLSRKMVEETDWFRTLPVVPGAIEGINELARHADVWICTKPLEANVTCRDEKAEWVRIHLGAKWEQRLIIAPNKSLVRGSILLDDAPFPEWFSVAEWQPVIFPYPYNGIGSPWADLPRWTWGDSVETLLKEAL